MNEVGIRETAGEGEEVNGGKVAVVLGAVDGTRLVEAALGVTVENITADGEELEWGAPFGL